MRRDPIAALNGAWLLLLEAQSLITWEEIARGREIAEVKVGNWSENPRRHLNKVIVDVELLLEGLENWEDSTERSLDWKAPPLQES